MRHKAMLIAVLFVSAVMSARLQAQESGGTILGGMCFQSYFGCGVGGHVTTGGGDAGGAVHSGECVTCLLNGEPADPWACHICDGSLDERSRLAYREALKAAATGNLQELLKLGQRAGGHVMFNRNRNMIQVSSCDRSTIVAALTLKNAADLRIATLLPSATQSSALANAVDR